MEEVIRPDSDIEQIARGDARRIMILVIRAGLRNPDASSAVIRSARADSVVDSGLVRPAVKPDGRLLGWRQGKNIVECGDGAGDLATIEAPGESDPGAVLLILITEVRGLLKSLIVIDAKDSGAHSGIEDKAAGLRSEKTSSCVSKCRVGLEAMQVGCR